MVLLLIQFPFCFDDVLHLSTNVFSFLMRPSSELWNPDLWFLASLFPTVCICFLILQSKETVLYFIFNSSSWKSKRPVQIIAPFPGSYPGHTVLSKWKVPLKQFYTLLKDFVLYFLFVFLILEKQIHKRTLSITFLFFY